MRLNAITNHLPPNLPFMKSGFTLFLLTLGAFSAHAQDIKKIDEHLANKAIAADTSKKKPWKIGGSLTLGIAQQNSSYWTGVTEEYAFTLASAIDMYANMTKGKGTWDNTLKAAYAYTHNQSQGVRKISDFFDLFSKYGHSLNEKKTMSVAGIFNLRSQFTDGFDYTQTPVRRTSDYFAPANLLLTVGLDWKPAKYFSLYFSPFASRWVIVSNDPYSYSVPGGAGQKPISELYGVDPEEKVDAQFGAFLSANFNKDLAKNLNYSSRLDFYSNYQNNPGNIDIFWTNTLMYKVTNWLGLSYKWNVAYDDDFTPEGLNGPRVQFLSTFGVAITGKF
jgi:hypothetical protein